MAVAQRKIVAQPVDTLIHIVRGQKVMLDEDLARLYEVPTKALNQAVKRNIQGDSVKNKWDARLRGHDAVFIEKYLSKVAVTPAKAGVSFFVSLQLVSLFYQIALRNLDRFPEDFMLQLTKEELALMRSQFVTASKRNVKNQYVVFAVVSKKDER